MAKTQVKSGKTEMVAFRIAPRLRFLAEIAARRNGESLSSFVERALAYALLPESTIDEPDYGNGSFLPMELRPLKDESYWDEDEAERFANIATLGNYRLFSRGESDKFLQIIRLYHPQRTDESVLTHEQIVEGFRKIKAREQKAKVK